MDNKDIDLAILSGDFDKPIPQSGCFKFLIIWIGIIILIIVLFFVTISILGYIGNDSKYPYEFMKYMKK